MKNKPVYEKVTLQTNETPQTDLDYISEKFHVSTEELLNRGCVAAKVRDHLLVQLFSDSFFFLKGISVRHSTKPLQK